MIAARWVVVGALLGGCVFTTKPMIPGDPSDMENRGDSGAVTRADAPSPNFDVGLVPTDTGAPLDGAPPAADAGEPRADSASTGTPEAGMFADAPASVDAPAFDAGGVADVGAPRDCGAADGGDGGRCADVDADVDAAVDAAAGDGGGDATVADAE